MADDPGTIHNLIHFEIGELPDLFVALLLGYATSPEKLAKREMESFVIGMSRDKASELGRALIATAERVGRS